MSRPPFGLLNVNKPGGLSSRVVVDRVARLVKPAKAGHAGTLDPLATGVLVVGVGAATRLMSHVQHGQKTYVAKFRFGCRSNTDDITGEVVATDGVVPFDREDLERLQPRFLGKIEQTPPQFSAVHVNGQRAYRLARQGKAFEISARTVEVHSIEIGQFDFPDVEMKIVCGSGTYIRSIGRDLGELLGCGAVMSELTRTAIGPFHLDDAISFDEITAEALPAALQPAITAVAGLPKYECSTDDEHNLRHGRKITIGEGSRFTCEQTIAVITSAGKLACLARFDETNGVLAPKQVFPDAFEEVKP